MIARMAVLVPTRISGMSRSSFQETERFFASGWFAGQASASGASPIASMSRSHRLVVEIMLSPNSTSPVSTSSAMAADGVSKMRTSMPGCVLRNLLRIGGR